MVGQIDASNALCRDDVLPAGDRGSRSTQCSDVHMNLGEYKPTPSEKRIVG